MKNILVTGGAGFIGSNLVRYFLKKYKYYNILNLDKLTYAGNLENLKGLEFYKNHYFIKGDICDLDFINTIFKKYKIDSIIHLAAESHVDRSIKNPFLFLDTNIKGTINLLNVAKSNWKKNSKNIFYHVSTDEVYGSLGKDGLFTEKTPYDPHSPYSASKASSDHFVRAYGDTFGLNYLISNCSNNYGPFQFPEKLIPVVINNILNKNKIPIYGKGDNVRDWLYVIDHVKAIDLIFHNAKPFNTYNIGGSNEYKNIDLVKLIVDIIDIKLGNKKGYSLQLIKYVKDRLGHDLRYAIDSQKLKKDLNWMPEFNLRNGLKITIDWYLNNKDWLSNINDGTYLINNKNTLFTNNSNNK